MGRRRNSQVLSVSYFSGTGNLWHWKALRTDSLGSLFGKQEFGSGPSRGQVMPYPHSYLDNEFLNTTGHYKLGYDQYPDNFTIGSGENKMRYDTYLVAAHGEYDSSSHSWKWVAARKLATTPTLHVQQFGLGGRCTGRTEKPRAYHPGTPWPFPLDG
jgi:hypothetical protein